MVALLSRAFPSGYFQDAFLGDTGVSKGQEEAIGNLEQIHRLTRNGSSRVNSFPIRELITNHHRLLIYTFFLGQPLVQEQKTLATGLLSPSPWPIHTLGIHRPCLF